MVALDEHLTIDQGSWFRSLSVPPKVKSLGAYVRGAGFASVSPGSPYPPIRQSANRASVITGRTLSAYKFIYITDGSGIFGSEFHRNEPVRTGDMIMLFPQVWHRCHPLPNTGWKEYWIEFDGDSGSTENLSNLASQLNVSYHTFRHRFKAETGVSPRQFALEARLRKASDLLLRTEAPPGTIAELCGMNSQYFSKLFKKKIGLTPTDFRQQRRKRK
jgi:AraC-like DNA-binding protein